MLKLLKVELEDFKQYIDIGFREDYQLELYYDKSAKVSGMDAMIDNTYDKIKDFYNYFQDCNCYKVNFEDNDIGFVFVNKFPNVLISFSISNQYRNRFILKEFFNLINSFSALISFLSFGIKNNSHVQEATPERAICDKLYLDGEWR
jgi:hypothetical protein